MTVTGYSPDERSCGKWADGITASNKSVWTNAMQMVAADTASCPSARFSRSTAARATRSSPWKTAARDQGHASGPAVPDARRSPAVGHKHMPVTVWEYVEG